MIAWLVPAVAALAISLPTTVAAAPVHLSQAVLAAGAPARPFILDGRRWSCEATTCVGRSASAPAAQPAVRECRRFVRRAGAVVEYRQDGYVLSADELSQCNAALTGG